MPILNYRTLPAALAVVATAAAPAQASHFSVRVVDPHGGAIKGAQVTVACPQVERQAAVTEAEGIAVLPDNDRCSVTVGAAGFATWEGTVNDVRALRVVRLSLAPLEQRVVVTARGERRSWAPLAFARLGRDDLALTGWDPALALRYAKAHAGTTLGGDRVYVDGLPAAGVPPSSSIDELLVNPDPFSVLYSESDQNIIEVVSATPDRSFRWSGGLAPKKVGARNPLAPDMSLERTNADLSVGGPIPWTPLTYSVDLNRSETREERPVFLSPGSTPDRTMAEASGRSLVVGLVGHWRQGLRTRLSVVSSRGDDTAVDAGGFVRPEAAMANALLSDDVRFVLESRGRRFRYRTGLMYTGAHSTLHARSSGIGLLVLDTVTAGGAPLQEMRFGRRDWLWNNTVSRADSSWMAGWSVASETGEETLEPNPDGQVMFGSRQEHEAAMSGAPGGTLMRMAGTVHQRRESRTAAIFGEKGWRGSDGRAFRAGARLDYQSGDGVALSPRLTGRTSVHGMTLQSGIGLFRQNWSNDVLMQAQRFKATGAQWFVADVGPAGIASDARVDRIRTQIADDFTRPLSVVVRNGVEVRRSRFVPGIEYTWTSGLRRSGSRRVAVEDGWVDRLESTRRLRRHQTHARAQYTIAGARLVAHYEWVVSHDDGEGPFSFPELQDDLSHEWARSSGMSPHNLSIVANLPSISVDK